MSASRQQALADARKLARTFAAAPEPRRRAQAVISELKRAEGWSVTAQRALDAADMWVRSNPAVATLEPRLRELLIQMEKGQSAQPRRIATPIRTR